MNIEIFLVETIQPIGVFYTGKINSETLIKMAKIKTRSSGKGVQRDLKKNRTKNIAMYCKDPDATFPTPIILAIDSKVLNRELQLVDGTDCIYKADFDVGEAPFAEVLDGQHRLEGIKLAKGFKCDMPIAIMFDLTEEEKAYIFSTINSNQEKVDKSLIYELFELSSSRSPHKTCHEIARLMNSDVDSPFYEKLKMLGKATKQSETLSQGTFVTYLCRLMSRNPKEDMIKLKNNEQISDDPGCVLREYFIDNKDEVILKIIKNYFSAIAQVFKEEWNDSRTYVLSKTSGYGALIKAFPTIYKIGLTRGTLSEDFFKEIFEVVKSKFVEEKIDWTSNTVISGEQGQSNLSKTIMCIIEQEIV